MDRLARFSLVDSLAENPRVSNRNRGRALVVDETVGGYRMVRGIATGLVLTFVILAPGMAAACSGTSPTLTATTWADIQTCHTAASAGDTITYAGGDATVSTTLSITKYVKIVSSGGTITDNTKGGDPDAGGGPSLITITESTAGSTRLQGFTVQKGPGNCAGASSTIGVHCGTGAHVKIVNAVNGKPVLITANTFHQGRSGNSIVANTNHGVIWSNTFTGNYEVVASDPSGINQNCGNNSSALRHKPTLLATSWSSAPTYGTADTNGDQNLYFEANTVSFMAEAIDTDDNGRTVVRYSNFTDSPVIMHGVDTSGKFGARYVELYNNTFVVDQTPQASCGGLPPQPSAGIAIRGGTALIHHNVLPDATTPTWGPKYPVVFFVEQLRRNAGGFPCWSTVTAPGAGYPSPHQAGWGYTTGATTVMGTNCASCPVSQDIEPIYLWSNTGAGNYNAPYLANYDCGSGDACPNCSTCPLIAAYIQSGREYLPSTPRPGYTPYIYPHPLVGVGAPTGLTVR